MFEIFNLIPSKRYQIFKFMSIFVIWEPINLNSYQSHFFLFEDIKHIWLESTHCTFHGLRPTIYYECPNIELFMVRLAETPKNYIIQCYMSDAKKGKVDKKYDAPQIIKYTKTWNWKGKDILYVILIHETSWCQICNS